MLILSTQAAVGQHNRPLVFPRLPVCRTLRQHGLDGEGLTNFQHSCNRRQTPSAPEPHNPVPVHSPLKANKARAHNQTCRSTFHTLKPSTNPKSNHTLALPIRTQPHTCRALLKLAKQSKPSSLSREQHRNRLETDSGGGLPLELFLQCWTMGSEWNAQPTPWPTKSLTTP